MQSNFDGECNDVTTSPDCHLLQISAGESKDEGDRLGGKGKTETNREKERKGKEEYLYSAFLHQGTQKALRHGSHSFTCKQHHACLSFVAFTRCHHHSN